MSDYIPTELLDEILVRLPVQSLVRFTSVCKSWYSLITSHSFIAKHLNHRKTSTESFLLKHYKIERYLLFPGDVKVGHEVESPFSSSPSGYKRYIGSCNGLLCKIVFDANKKLYVTLWNPSIGKSITLPMPSQRDFGLFVGLGAHPKSHEYMLLSISYEKADVEQRIFPSKVELYTQGTAAWRSISSSGYPPHTRNLNCSQAFVNGAIHWIGSDSRPGDGFCNFIILFNLGSQAFLVMMMPAALVRENTLALSIMSYRESLAMFNSGTLAQDSCCLWMMKEYGVAESWDKLYNINLPGVFRNIRGFRENGEVLVWIDKQILCYNCETKTLTNTGLTRSSCPFFVVTFKESLVLLNPGDGVF